MLFAFLSFISISLSFCLIFLNFVSFFVFLFFPFLLFLFLFFSVFFLYLSMSTFKVVFSSSYATVTFVLSTTYLLDQSNSSYSEAVVRRCSVKKVYLVISQNSQENTCARVSFLNNFIKKETAKVFSCEFCEISKNNFFTEHLRTTDFVYYCSSLFFQVFSDPSGKLLLRFHLSVATKLSLKQFFHRHVHPPLLLG